jgi:hypothetical protein
VEGEKQNQKLVCQHEYLGSQIHEKHSVLAIERVFLPFKWMPAFSIYISNRQSIDGSWRSRRLLTEEQ